MSDKPALGQLNEACLVWRHCPCTLPTSETCLAASGLENGASASDLPLALIMYSQGESSGIPRSVSPRTMWHLEGSHKSRT